MTALAPLRIVVVCPAIPHPFGDTAAKWSFVLVRELLARGCKVVLLTSTEEGAARVSEAESMLRACPGAGRLSQRTHALYVDRFALRRRLRSLQRPCSELAQDQGFVADLRRELARGYDVLHAEQLFTGWLALDQPRALLNVHHLEVIDWEERRPTGPRERKALWQMTRATAHILGRARNVRFFSTRLLDRARTMNREARYWTLPFALDLDLYPEVPLLERPVLGLIGSMHWLPSRSAGDRLLTRIWPLVKHRVPEARLLVAGWNALRHLGRHLPLPDVEIEENLPHPESFFARTSVMAYAPARGSGMKIKVMEAMAYGVPVVTTAEGVEGLDVRSGEHCWVEEDDRAIADRVAALLLDVQARRHMRRAARDLIAERYSPSAVVGRMIDIYGEVARAE